MTPETRAAPPRLRVVVLALLLLALAIGVAGEVALRAYQKIAAGVPMFAWIPNRPERTFQLSPFLVFGPRVSWQIPFHPDSRDAFFNAQGFRTPDPVGPKPAGEIRVVTLGGSTTEDIWNDAGIHWPLVAECRIHQAGRTDVRVLNAGMSAYSSAHLLVRLEMDVLSYQPDVVIAMENVNDLTVNYAAADAGVAVDENYLVKYGQKSYTGVRGEEDVVVSRLWSAVRSRLGGAPERQPWGNADISVGRRAFARNLRNIVAVGTANGAQVVLLTMPATDSDSLYTYTQGGYRAGQPQVGPLPDDAQEFMRDFDSYNAAVEEVAAETGARVIPMARLMDRSERHFVDIVHYSTLGTRLFGETIAAELLPMLPPPAASLAPFSAADPACAWDRPVR